VRNHRPQRTRRQVLAGLAIAAGVAAARSIDAGAAQGVAGDRTGESGPAMESIHQTVTFEASRERVYAALTDAAEFNKVTLLSAAVRSGMAKLAKPTEIAREPGGAFSLFGGLIVGRQIELVANRRIVQAWRAIEWPAGVYSIARFELVAADKGTELVFDHTGFPPGQGEHLAQGWKVNYWEPLEKFLTAAS
jgi:activator of HSP90 ATPase